MGSDGRLPLRVALPLSFVVGTGALVIETTWMRWFRAIIGATAPSVSAVLVSLSLGQLLGALLGGRIASDSTAPLRAFVYILLVAIACAFAVEPVLGVGAGGAESTFERFVFVLGVTLPASTSIGASFPLLVAATSSRAGDLGPHGTALYASDLAGAALGAALNAFWLPATIGVRGAHAAGATLLLVAAVASRRWLPLGGGASSARTKYVREWPTPETALIGFGSGFCVFAAQLLLHQAFGRVLDQSTFALGAILTTTLLSLAVGAVSVALLRKRLPSPSLVAGSASLAAFAFAGFPAVFVAATDGLSLVVAPRETATYVPRAMLLCALVAGPSLIAAAGVLPSLFVRAGEEAEGDGRAAGHVAGALLAANTIGAVTGALVAPYVLLPTLGLWPSFVVLALVYASMSALAVRPRRYAFAVGITLAVVCGLAQPWRYPPLKIAEGDELLHTHRSAAGLVAVIKRGDDLLIQTDNHYVLGGTADAKHQERQGHLPLLLHPAPRRVAFVGTATGSSAGVAFIHGVEELVTVEIMPGVAGAAARYFGAHNATVYADPRTRVVEDDVRSFLRTTEERFDVIVADLFVPWRAETGSLYTVEHFSRVKERLRSGGMFCQWLPLYQLGSVELESILVTFLDVFPEAQVFRGDFYGAHAIVALMGAPGGDLDPATASVAATEIERQGVDDRWVTHPLGPWALYVGPLRSLASQLIDAPLNRENEPVVEFASARNPARHSGRTSWTASRTTWLELSRTMLRGRDWESRRDSLAGRRTAAGGFALQTASTHWVEGNREAASRALGQAVKLLPRELLADAPPDPTASDVWP